MVRITSPLCIFSKVVSVYYIFIVFLILLVMSEDIESCNAKCVVCEMGTISDLFALIRVFCIVHIVENMYHRI
jgi:hypothetical protein